MISNPLPDHVKKIKMEKQLKDYLHLYLGCELIGILDDEERKGYLTGIHGEYEVEIQFFNDDGINVSEEPEYNQYTQVKPILRPLSDMTGEEAYELEEYMWDGFVEAMTGDRDSILKMFTGPGEYRPGFEIYVRAINWCRSHSFDCDKLIDCGLAISKTK